MENIVWIILLPPIKNKKAQVKIITWAFLGIVPQRSQQIGYYAKYMGLYLI